MSKPYPERHQRGMVSIENKNFIFSTAPESPENYYLEDCDLGVHISVDGRVWICINGIAFLRFKPNKI